MADRPRDDAAEYVARVRFDDGQQHREMELNWGNVRFVDLRGRIGEEGRKEGLRQNVDGGVCDEM